jgi:hypothetical protein
LKLVLASLVLLKIDLPVLVLNKHGEMNRYINFQMVPFHEHIVCGNIPSGIQHYLSITYLAVYDAQELTTYIFDFKPNAKQNKKMFSVYTKILAKSLGQTMDTLSNNAKSPLKKATIS